MENMNKTEENVYVIVYGTLMKDKRNNRLLYDGEYVGEGGFVGDIYDLPYGYPALVGGRGICIGEVYKVNKNTLNRLDMLEGYDERNDRGLYVRRNIVVCMSDGRELNCLGYIWGRGELPDGAIKLPDNVKWSEEFRGEYLDSIRIARATFKVGD